MKTLFSLNSTLVLLILLLTQIEQIIFNLNMLVMQAIKLLQKIDKRKFKKNRNYPYNKKIEIHTHRQ